VTTQLSYIHKYIARSSNKKVIRDIHDFLPG
jgi:hypothetical protein